MHVHLMTFCNLPKEGVIFLYLIKPKEIVTPQVFGACCMFGLKKQLIRIILFFFFLPNLIFQQQKIREN